MTLNPHHPTPTGDSWAGGAEKQIPVSQLNPHHPTPTGDSWAGGAEKQIPVSKIQKDLDAALARNREYDALRKKRSQVLQPAMAKADADGRQYIGRSKKVLAVQLGDDWNEFWAEAGYNEESIRTPSSLGGREKLLKALAAYFTSRPAQESSDFNVTAALATKHHAAMASARTALESHAIRQKAARASRDKAVTTLRRRLRAALSEVDLLLERDSAIWASLGLTSPAEKVRRRSSKKDPKSAAAPAASPRSTVPAGASDGVALAV
jgi:hypothetical protein